MTKLCLGGLFIFSFYITFQKRYLWAENQVLGSLELTCCNEVIELKGITLQMFTVCDVLLLTEKLQMKSLRSSNSVCWKCVTVGWRYMQSQPICSQLALQSLAHTCDIVKKKKNCYSPNTSTVIMEPADFDLVLQSLYKVVLIKDDRCLCLSVRPTRWQ